MAQAAADWVSAERMKDEYAAKLGDQRLDRRVAAMGAAIAEDPSLSIPKIFSDDAGLEAAYRALRNERAHWRDLAAPHSANTVKRAAAVAEVLVAHDTTDVTFAQYWPDEQRRFLQSMSSRKQGFLLHTSLAIAATGQALPYGVLDMQPFVHRSGLDADDAECEAFWHDEGGLFHNEHERWARGVAQTNDLLVEQGVRPIHVMDRETDSYGLLSWMCAQQCAFVVRATLARRLQQVTELRQFEALEVQLGARFAFRDTDKVKKHPTRRARKAKLTVRAGEVELMRARDTKDLSWSPPGFVQPKTLGLNLVEAIEQDPPAGDKGVRWLLLTTEPIDTKEQVLRVVEIYRRRWVIEEYFKSLKTGCQLESRQMETAQGLLRMLALLVPAAWRLLLLRSVASEDPQASWSKLLLPEEFRILRAAYNRIASKNKKMPKEATVLDCLNAIAKLGGHLQRNGAPGWQTLQAGWAALQRLLMGAKLGEDAIND